MTIDYRDAKLLWPGLYKAVHEILGDAHVIIPLGDELVAGTVNATSFEAKAMGATAPTDLTWTPSEALSAFDTPFDLTDPDNWKGVAPVAVFNGTDEEADTLHDGFYSRAGGVFSVGAWVNLTDATSSTILAKYNASGDGREWIFFFNASDQLNLELIDEDDATTPNAKNETTADTATSEGSWHFVVATYDGSADASGINLYQDGILVASTDVDDANFASLRDTGSLLEIGSRSAAGEDFFDGKMAGGPIGPFFCQKELSATEVLDLYHIGAHALSLA